MKRWAKWTLPILAALCTLLLGGCGSSSDEKAPQAMASVDLTAASPEFPNADLLVSAESLQANIAAGAVSTAAASQAGGKLVIIDARAPAVYSAGHIPGAINLQHNAFWTGGVGLKETATVAALLGEAGLARDTKVVIYDNTSASFGAAGRLFWMLEYFGSTDVHILDGGWDKWAADGRPTETASVVLPAATFVPEVNGGAKTDSARIAKRLYDPDFVVVDARTDEEFMGWQLYGEARGGHIPGAVNLPYAWFFNTDKTTLGYQDLKTLLESRGVTPDKEVAAHCTVGIRSGYVYFLLRLMGYPKASNYDASIVEWANTDYPMEKAPNYASVVNPAWIKKLIDYHAPGSASAAPPEYPYAREHKYLIFETQWGSFDDMQQGWADDSYLRGHIPGAIHSNSDVYENGFPRWFLLPDDELKVALGSMGITPDTTVVVYSSSNIFAARLWWILKYAGVADVRMLNGGYAAWQASGYPTETTINHPVATVYEGDIDSAVMATTDYVAANYDSATVQMVDVRSGGEYAGLVSGYSYVVNKGRIPGAIWAYDADDASPVYSDKDGTLRSYSEVRDFWRGIDIRSTAAPDLLDKEAIFYCGSGYRSALAFFYAHLMGYTNVRNYSDGWEGWSTTYTEDPTYQKDPDIPGSTDGWRQDPSGRPFSTGGALD